MSDTDTDERLVVLAKFSTTAKRVLEAGGDGVDVAIALYNENHRFQHNRTIQWPQETRTEKPGEAEA